MEYIGLERGRDVIRAAGAEKSLGERAMKREVNIVVVYEDRMSDDV